MKMSFTTFACPQWPLGRIVATARGQGYGGVEFRCDADHRHGVEVWASAGDRREVHAALEGEGMMACCLATSVQCLSERAAREAQPRIELAGDIGCPAVRVFCGPAPEHMPMPEVVLRVGETLAELALAADPLGVSVLLETHDTLSRGADAAAAVRAAEHAAVGVNYNNIHPFRKGEEVAATFAALKGLIRHVHLHDAMNLPAEVDIRPLGQGQMPLDAMFAGLVAEGYQGFISGEWFGRQYGPDPDAAIAQFSLELTDLAKRQGVEWGR
jgi:sugar phosphate isomerase/epimerase